jgi:hypothetical protein
MEFRPPGYTFAHDSLESVFAPALSIIRRRIVCCQMAIVRKRSLEMFECSPVDKDGHECCHGSFLKPGRNLRDRSSNLLAGYLSIQVAP